MIDPKLVDSWNIVFALAEKGCGYYASYQAQVMDPRPCSGSDPWWVLIAGCPAGCTSSPPPGLPTNPYPCQPDYETDYHVTPEAIECCEGIVQVECSGTCCKCGGAICGATETCCDNVCVNTNTDEYHCGGCNIPCEPSGKCCPQPCNPDQCTNTTINWTWVPSGDCPATTENPYPEGGEWTTPDNCPSGCAGKVSPGFPMDICGPSSATQQCACPLEGLPICVDITTKDNCGDCGIPCPDDKPACCNGICCTTENCCSIDDILTCIDVKNNHEHCGSCNHPCAAEEICCSGECANTQLDNDHCGSCPNKCPEGFICCSGVCKNVVGTDALNCGDCDRSCDGGEACKDGVCVDPCTTEECSFTWNEPTCTFIYNNPNGYKICSGNATIKWVPTGPPQGDPMFATCAGHWETLIPCEYSENCGCALFFGNGQTFGSCFEYTNECPCVHRPDAASPCLLPFPVLDPVTGWAGGEWQQITACDRGGVNCQAPEDPPVIPECFGHTYTFPCDPFWNPIECPNCACPINQPDRDGTADLEKVSSACKKCLQDCGANQKCCNKVCKDVLTDESNCGFCGKVCAIGEECCNGDCIETQTSELHCGFCNNPCALFETCCAGSCRDLHTDDSNCGQCGRACAAGESCCPFPGTNYSVCVNKNTDENNCGKCGFECPNSDQCIDGNCVPCDPPCLEAGTACCNNQCVDILWNESRCGNCTTVCGLGQTCCNGICKNTQKDMYNCGDCGIECPQGINQINLWQCCKGQCKNLKTDPENCGFCGRVCRDPPYDTFTVPKCFLGNCADPECECQGYEQGMPPQPGPNDVAFVASCVGNTTGCDGPCYFDAVGGAWVLHEEDGFGYSGTCGQEPDYVYCADDRISCVDDKLACVGDIYYCVQNIEGQDMATYCIPKASFNAETQAKIGEYIGAENCAAGCSGDGTCPDGCPNGKTCCNTECVDTQTDKANCGGCGGGPCADDEACKNGSCTGCPSPCAEDETCCEGGTTCCKVCCNDGCCADSDYCGAGGGCVECECTVPGTTCCGGECCAAGTVCCGSGSSKACCTADQYCDGNGRCTSCQTPVCYPEQKCCSGTCIDNPCGDCPNSCTEGQKCCENECTDVGTDTNCTGCGDVCGAGTKCCDGACIDVLSDVENCGACEVVCEEDGATPLCCDGVPTAKGSNENCLSCGDTADPDNPTDPTSCCPKPVVIAGAPDESTFFITNTNTDDENCGGCGNVADTSPYVKEKCCDGEIVSLLTDDDNCGACGTRALAPKICCPHVGPPDAYGDPPPPTATQVNPNTDDKNCGGCGNVVDTSDQVQQKCCDGGPVNTLTDDDNCGACGVRVEEPKICCPHWGPLDIYGELPRPTATQVDPNTDDENCGGCGNAVDTSDQVQQKCCDGGPVNTLTDNDNCGGCGIRTVGTDICCPKWGPPNIYGDLPKPTATIVDPNTDNDNCGGCGNKCNAVESGAECPESGDPPTTKCVNGECVPCGTCKLPTESQQAFLLGSAPTFWGQRTTIPCTYDACPPSDPPPNPSLPAKTCFGGCEYKAIGNVNNLQWELVSCECYDSCNVPECTGAFAEAHGNACPSVGYCSAGEGPCASCRYLDYDNPSEYKCTAPWGHDAVGCNYDILGTYGANPSNYTCCDHEHPGGTLCNGGCPSVYEDESEHFPTCAPCGGSCPDGLTCCGDFPNDTCVDTKNDEGHCGTCPNVCLAGQTCCDGSCKNLDNDKDHCGSCPNKCTGDLECCGGECKDIYGNDDSNCGSCGNVCITGHCCGGDCKNTDTDESNCGLLCIACDAGETCCGGSCVNTDTDEANCGGCEQPCAGGECCGGTCRNSSYFQTSETDCGGCEQPCAAGETCCAGSCIDTISLETDEANCGNCGIVCAESETCCGECIATSSLQTDEANCGGCGQPCTAEQTCCAGSCVATSSLETDEANCGECGNACTAGQTCCAGTCRDSSYFQTSDANCGECGNACEPGEECLLGSCNLPPLTIKVYFQAYGCSGDCPPPYDSPSCGSSVLSSGSRSVSYTTTWGASGSISNSSSTITLGIANVPVGTALTIYLSGYVSGSASHTRAATYPGSPPTHTFYFNGYDDLNC